MHTRKLGQTDIDISPIILGMWSAGKQYWVGVDDRETTRTIHRALDVGITTFDTAEDYGEGHSERVLGAALADRRERAVILTKVFSNHLGRAALIEACERSLQNLGTDYVDLYQIHWPAGSWGSEPTPIAETMAALHELLDAGKIRAIGVSNFDRAQLEEVCALGPVASLQPPYSLFWRHVEAELLPFCQAQGMSVLAYSPLAQGILSGRLTSVAQLERGDHRHANKLLLPEHLPRVHAALAQLRTIADELGVTLAQLALAWLIGQDQVCAIAGARTPTQVEDNAAAMNVELSAELREQIAAIGWQVAAPLADDPVPWTWDP